MSTGPLVIDPAELTFQASRSSGPGGQNVNKVASRVTVSLDVVNSSSLSDEQRDLVLERLANRLTKHGVLSVSSQSARSQLANRELATERLLELVAEALDTPVERKRTRVPKKVHRRRLKSKKQRAALKKTRSTRYDNGDH